MRSAAPTLIAILFMIPAAAPAGPDEAGPRPGRWVGTWTWDLCHEDRKPGHDPGRACREGLDRIVVEQEGGGGIRISRCPADPWRESNVRLEGGGRTLRFRTPEGLDVRLTLDDNGTHYRGRFRSSDGHAGRILGRKVSGCG